MAGHLDALISHLKVPDGKSRVFWLSDSEAFGSSLLIGLTKGKPILCLISPVALHADATPDVFETLYVVSATLLEVIPGAARVA